MDSDEFDIYLRQIRRTPLLTAQQEVVAVRRLEFRRQRLRFRLLSSPFVLHGAIALAEQVAAGKRRVERVIEVDVRDLANKHRLTHCISPQLKRVRHLHDASVRAYADWLHLHQHEAFRRHLLKRRELVRLMEQLEIRLEKLQGMWVELMQSQGRETSSPHDEGQDCCCLTLETQQTFQRWHRIAVQSASAYVQAKNALVTPNLPLVVSVAKRYRVTGRDMLDLVQEGNLGLMRAADKFKSSFGRRFSTYAVWWIRQAMVKMIQHDRLVRPSHDAKNRAREIDNCRQMLSHQLHREPTLAEIGAAMQLDELTVEKTDLLNVPLLCFELEPGWDPTLDQAIHDIQQAPGEPDEESSGLLRQQLCQIMNALNVRESEVVLMRYGWDGHGKRTLVEISRSLGVSRSRVSQIEQVALKKLRQQWALAPDQFSL